MQTHLAVTGIAPGSCATATDAAIATERCIEPLSNAYRVKLNVTNPQSCPPRHAMVYRGRERRSRQRVVLKAYSQQQRNPVRAAALEREQEMLAAAAPHPGILGLERVLEVRH